MAYYNYVTILARFSLCIKPELVFCLLPVDLLLLFVLSLPLVSITSEPGLESLVRRGKELDLFGFVDLVGVVSLAKALNDSVTAKPTTRVQSG